MLLLTAVMAAQSVLCFMRKPALDIINLAVGLVMFFTLNRSFVRLAVKKGLRVLKHTGAPAGAAPKQSAPCPEERFEISNPDTEEPVLFTDKRECCGCSACFAVCPAGAISMEEDEEGFLYPKVDRSKCVKCFRCLDVCAFKADRKKKECAAPKPQSEE